jgi:hypothetical protein
VYTLNINATNTDTVGNNKVTLPGGHIFTLPQTVNQNESATTTVKIKYFTTE